MTIEELLQRITDLENQVSDLKNQKDPGHLQYRLNAIQVNIDTFSNQISEIESLVKAFNIEDRFAELFTSQELKKWYECSGLTIPDINGYLLKLTGKNIPAYDCFSGKVEDIILLSKLGKYLRMQSIKNAKKTI